MPMPVIRNLSNNGGAIVFGGCPGVVVVDTGGLMLSQRLLAETMQELKLLGVRRTVCLFEAEELQDILYEDITDATEALGIDTAFFPIPDYSVPNESMEPELDTILDDVTERIEKGEAVFLHCFAGYGRSALMAGCVLMRMGMTADEAIKTLRQACPEAIETNEQLLYLTGRSAGKRNNSL